MIIQKTGVGQRAARGVKMNKLSKIFYEIAENVAAGAFVAVLIPIGVIGSLASFLFPGEPYLGENTYGFKDKDFVRMHFPPAAGEAMEEGYLAWIDFRQSGNYCGDRLCLSPVSQKLIERWKKEIPGALPIYDTGRLEHFKLASANDNVEIKQYLFKYYKPEYANRYYKAWLKRLDEKRHYVSA